MPHGDEVAFHSSLRETSSHMRIVHDAAEVDMRFNAGGPGQWDEKDYKKLRDEGRPALSIDQTGPTTRSVAGAEVVNRFEAKFLARNSQLDDIDTIASEAYGEVYKWSWQNSGAEHHVSRAYHDTIITGYGWTETYLDFEGNPDGQIITRWVPQFEVGFDPDARAMNLTDSRYLIRGKWLSEEDFEFAFPDASKDGAMGAIRGVRHDTFPGGFMSRSGSIGDDYDESSHRSEMSPWFDNRSRRFLVYEHQYYERQRWFRVNVPEVFPPFQYGDDLKLAQPGRQWIHPDDMDDFIIGAETMLVSAGADKNQTNDGLAILQRDTEFLPRKIYYQDFHGGPIKLDGGLSQINDFSYLGITGFSNQGDPSQMHWMGMVETMKDPQRLINSLVSSIIWLIRQNPNALMYERGSFVDEDHALRVINDPSANVELVEGSIRDGRVQPRLGRNPLPSGIGDMLSFAMGAMPLVSGVSPFFSGQVNDLKRTPAASVQSVQRQTMSMLSVLMDSLRHYRKNHARISMQFMRALRPDVIARVISPRLREQGAHNIIFNTDIADYDIVVDEAQTSATAALELRQDLVQGGLLTQMLGAGAPIPPTLAENLGLPSATAAELKQAMQIFWDRTLQAAQQPPGAEGQPPVQ